MVAITKLEKEAVVERFPQAHIVRTMKQKSKRHRYYCEETPAVMKYLNTLRGVSLGDEKKDGVKRDYRKKTKRVSV